MRIEGDRVSLISYGKDVKPGGFGEDRDVIGVFNAKSASGRWTAYDTDEFWMKTPLSVNTDITTPSRGSLKDAPFTAVFMCHFQPKDFAVVDKSSREIK
jgi:hypothetical protein